MENKHIKSIKDLAKISEDNSENNNSTTSYFATAIEHQYIKSLKNGKDILDYRKQREEEVFLENI